MVLFFAIRTEWAQNKATTYLAKHFSKEWNTTVSLDRIYIDLLTDVHLEGLYIADQHNDTLIYVGELEAGLLDYNLEETRFEFRTVTVLDGAFYLKKYTGEEGLNLQFIVDAFATSDTSASVKPIITAEEVWIDGLRFRLDMNEESPQDFGVDYQHLDVSGFQMRVHHFLMQEDSLSGLLDSLALRERSGVNLKKMSGMVHVDPADLRIDSLYLKTNESVVSTDLHFHYGHYRGFQNFIEEVYLNLHIDIADVQGADIAFFAPVLQGIRQRVKVSGKVKGPVNNLSVRQLDLHYGSDSHLKGNVDLAGLPDIQETFILLDVKEIVTNQWDLSQLPYPPFRKRNTLPISERFSNLGTIQFAGNFTGFINDFVAFGTLNSEIGTISSDLHLTREPETDLLVYNGELKTRAFHLGEMLDATATLGRLTMDMKVDGRGTTAEEVFANLDGVIGAFTVNGYSYRNAQVKGSLNQQLFDGELQIKDPNVELDFIGKVDFSSKIPEFHFTTRLEDVNLPALHLVSRDTSSRLSTYIEMDLVGNSLENINGTVTILNTSYTEEGRTVEMDSLQLVARPHSSGRRITLNSTYVDGELVGLFNTGELGASFTNLLGEPLPGLLEQGTIKTANQRFDFSLNVKRSNEITSIFYPDLIAKEPVRIKGHYYVEDRSVTMSLKTPQATYSGVKLTQPEVDFKLENGILNLKTETDRAALTDSVWVDDFQMITKGLSNTLQVGLSWEHRRPKAYNGNLSALIQTNSRNNFSISLLDSEVLLADSLWTVKTDQAITIDSGAISVGNLVFEHKNQQLRVDGELSHSYEDVLDIELHKIDLNWINLLTESIGFQLAGQIDGEASLSNPYDGLVIDSKLDISNLFLNDKEIGAGRLVAEYRTQTDDVNVHGFLGQAANPFLTYKGNYWPKRKEENLDLEIDINKFDVDMLSPLLVGQLSEMAGEVEGKISLTGSTYKPLLDGSLHLDSAAFLVDYLNTKYLIEEAKIIVANDWFGFDYITIKDDRGKPAYANGTVLHENFGKFNFDVSIFTNDFRLLKTKLKNNQLYYGTANLGGSFNIGGYADNLLIELEGKTKKGTEFFIPLSGSEEVSESDFITFVTKGKDLGDKQKPKIDLTGIQLNIDLEVTRDATAQIIFDEKVGDVIKATGEGNIQMEINTLGTFNIFGEYVIDKGDYLFTLQNIINKHFEIEKGSSIAWNGDPYDAQLGIDAIYSLRTNLYDLTGDSTQRSKSEVDVRLSILDRLSDPQYQFSVEFPSDPNSLAADLVSSMSDQDLNRQVFSLLILNRFVAFDNTLHGENIGTTSTSELLSNQLSNWLSKISNDFDIGFKYRPGDEISSDEVQVALSTQLFNDRVSIEGNLGVVGDNPSTEENTGTVVGDFKVEYKIGDGRMRAKVYNKSNDYNLANANNSPYTQGAGIFVREEFNTFGDLWRRVFGKRKRPPKEKKEKAPKKNDPPAEGLKEED